MLQADMVRMKALNCKGGFVCEVKEMVDWAIDAMRDDVSGMPGSRKVVGILKSFMGKELSRAYPDEKY